jgi:hypothetical protein
LARYDTLKHDVCFDAIMVEVEPILTLFTNIIVNLEPELLVGATSVDWASTANGKFD